MNNSLLVVLQLPHMDKKSLNEEINEMILLANTLNYNITQTIIAVKIDSVTVCELTMANPENLLEWVKLTEEDLTCSNKAGFLPSPNDKA